MAPADLGLIGSYKGRVDQKYRVVIPAKVREAAVGDFELVSFFVTPTRTLRIVTRAEWLRIQKNLAEYGSTNEHANRYLNLSMGMSGDVEIDDQGRMLVGQRLCNLIGVTKDDRDIIIVCKITHIDIWTASHYEAYKQGQSPAVDETFRRYEEAALQLKL